jgi:SagB-type dehydrogenase family enzyme
MASSFLVDGTLRMPIPAAYRLSPYCVFHVDPDGETATLVHALYGSRFSIASDLLPALVALNNGAAMDSVLAPLPTDAREAIHTLIEENVIIATDEIVDSAPFHGRLNPIELAVHRGFNEGGYMPELVDPRNAPAIAKKIPGNGTIPLESHPAPNVRMDLLTCLRTRRSVRAYSDLPLAKRDFEQFLQLAASARALVETPASGQISFRPYPGGGALHPLEIYPVVYDVESIEPGIYYYHPFKHELTGLQSDTGHRAALATVARQKMPVSSSAGPAVLLLITAVFARICWKYTGMPYQAILMETGALYQTMYLVANSLGLAPCAIGAFPERATAEILGADSRDESQVGMFALGVPKQNEVPEARITAVRLLEQSLFSHGPGGEALELTFDDTSREIMPLHRLHLEPQCAGGLACKVRAGRALATIDESALRDLLSLLQRQHR